ncbi:MAG: RNA polymerase sigma factor, partial [Candidatus Aminicenantales bacterium]
MDENAIIEGMARGDQRAFHELVERFKKKVYYLALDMAGNPVDAEDISQEVFLKVYRSFATFRKGAKLSSWLYRITYNASIDHLRRKGAAPEAVADELIESSIGSDAGLPRRGAADPGAALESSQLQDRI